MDLLSETIRRRLDGHLANRLGSLLSAPQLGMPGRLLLSHLRNSGGKRIRPQLCLWTRLQMLPPGRSSRELSEGELDIACAWEMFHAFLLVHDDIVDAADRRRDGPSLHRVLAECDGGSAVFGRNLAIIIGDLLFAGAMKVLHEAEVSAEAHRAVLRLFSKVAVHTGMGQAADMLQSHVPLSDVAEDAVLRGYHGKTAAYTFEGPILSGAILGSADGAQQECLSRFAVALGQAYQLHNDLLDLGAPVHDGSDLMQGKRTLTLVQARALLEEAQRPQLDAQLAALRPGGREALRKAEALRRMLYAAGAVDATRRVMAELLREARRAAEATCLPATLRLGLLRLLRKLNATYFASPAPEAASAAPRAGQPLEAVAWGC